MRHAQALNLAAPARAQHESDSGREVMEVFSTHATGRCPIAWLHFGAKIPAGHDDLAAVQFVRNVFARVTRALNLHPLFQWHLDNLYLR